MEAKFIFLSSHLFWEHPYSLLHELVLLLMERNYLEEKVKDMQWKEN